MTTKYKLYQYCKIQKKVVPIEDVQVKVPESHYIITDEMAPVRNPLNSKEIYTSKRKLREAYKAAGAVEIGDAYEKGYDPGRDDSRRQKELVNRVMNQIRERLNG
jgi:glutamyl-tRNA reductase